MVFQLYNILTNEHSLKCNIGGLFYFLIFFIIFFLTTMAVSFFFGQKIVIAPICFDPSFFFLRTNCVFYRTLPHHFFFLYCLVIYKMSAKIHRALLLILFSKRDVWFRGYSSRPVHVSQIRTAVAFCGIGIESGQYEPFQNGCSTPTVFKSIFIFSFLRLTLTY